MRLVKARHMTNKSSLEDEEDRKKHKLNMHQYTEKRQ